jgi:hypothetical protein
MDLQPITGLFTIRQAIGEYRIYRIKYIESQSPVRRCDTLSTTNLTYTYYSGTESRPSWCDIDDRLNELWCSLLVFTHLKQKFQLHAQET